jgi:hypothetical protein
MMLVGGGLAVVSAFLPWATVGPFTINGTAGDGQITLVLGAILAGLGAMRLNGKGGKAIPWVGVVLAALIGLVGAYHYYDLDSDVSSVGIGVYGTLIGAAFGFTGGLIGRQYQHVAQSAVTKPSPNANPIAGWYTDPWNPIGFRYWDGTQWTGHESSPKPPE